MKALADAVKFAVSVAKMRDDVSAVRKCLATVQGASDLSRRLARVAVIAVEKVRDRSFVCCAF